MTDAEKVNAFLAARGVTRIEPEKRALTPAQIKAAVRGELPERKSA